MNYYRATSDYRGILQAEKKHDKFSTGIVLVLF